MDMLDDLYIHHLLAPAIVAATFLWGPLIAGVQGIKSAG